MRGSKFYGGGNQSKKSALRADNDVAFSGLLPEVEVKDKKDTIGFENPTEGELAKANRRGKESSDGQSASMQVNKTTGERKMVTVISDKDKYNKRKEAEAKIFEYNTKNKNKPDYVRQTFKKNIGADNEYISGSPTTMKKAPMKKEDPSAGVRAKNKAEIDAEVKAENARRLAIVRRKKAKK